MTLLQLLGLACPPAAMSGAIISGIVLSKAKTNTKWRSKIGFWAIVGMILLIVGMFGWIHYIVYN